MRAGYIEVTTVKSHRRILVNAEEIDLVVEHKDKRIPTAREIFDDTFRPEDTTQIVLRSGEQGICRETYDEVVEMMGRALNPHGSFQIAGTRGSTRRTEGGSAVAAD